MKLLVAIALFAVSASILPVAHSDEFRVCKRSDPNFLKCLPGAFKEAFLAIANGYEPKKVPPIEPLLIENLWANSSLNVIKLNLRMHEAQLHGLTKGIRASNYKFDWENNRITCRTYNPHVDLTGDYNVFGSILLWPIRGAGYSKISMYDLVSKHSIQFERVEKNGQISMDIKRFDVTFHPKRVTLYFGHLEKNQSFLAQQIRNYIHSNANTLFKQLKAPYEKEIGLEFLKIANMLFRGVPLNRVFPN